MTKIIRTIYRWFMYPEGTFYYNGQPSRDCETEEEFLKRMSFGCHQKTVDARGSMTEQLYMSMEYIQDPKECEDLPLKRYRGDETVMVASGVGGVWVKRDDKWRYILVNIRG